MSNTDKQTFGEVVHQNGFILGCIGLTCCLVMRDMAQFLAYDYLSTVFSFRYILAGGRLLATLLVLAYVVSTRKKGEGLWNRGANTIMTIVFALFQAAGLTIRLLAGDDLTYSAGCFLLGIGQGGLICAWMLYFFSRSRKTMFYSLIVSFICTGIVVALLSLMTDMGRDVITVLLPLISIVSFVLLLRIDVKDADEANRAEKTLPEDAVYPRMSDPGMRLSIVLGMVTLVLYSFLARQLTDLWMQLGNISSLVPYELAAALGTALAAGVTYAVFSMHKTLKNRSSYSFFVVPIVAIAVYLSTMLTGEFRVVFVPLVFILRKMMLVMAVFAALRVAGFRDRYFLFCLGMCCNELGQILKNVFYQGLALTDLDPNTVGGIVAMLALVVVAAIEFRDFLKSQSGTEAIRAQALEQAQAQIAAAAAQPSEADLRAARFNTVIQSMSDDWKLSSREKDVLEMLVAGRNADYVAKTLVVAHSTAKSHISHIYQKSGYNNQQRLMDDFEGRMAEAEQAEG